MLNELDATAMFEEQVNSGEVNTTGGYKSRDWSFNITNFTKNIEEWANISPRVGSDDHMEWRTKGWI